LHAYDIDHGLGVKEIESFCQGDGIEWLVALCRQYERGPFGVSPRADKYDAPLTSVR